MQTENKKIKIYRKRLKHIDAVEFKVSFFVFVEPVTLQYCDNLTAMLVKWPRAFCTSNGFSHWITSTFSIKSSRPITDHEHNGL